MPELKIDEKLVDWNEMSDQKWENLLIGNGFSINIWGKFGYGTLFELAQKEEIDEPLTKEGLALFAHLKSSNFEDVLRILYYAKIVDEQLGCPQEEDIQKLYRNTKNALASAVNYAHIAPNKADTATINEQLRPYKNVFTTNYDLIPYWSIMYSDTGKFRDYFWGDNGCFDISDTDAPASVTKLHYLHGAIHLVERSDGKTQKLTANNLARLSDLFDLSHPERFPLFISEGSSEWKISRIKRNDYLRFCYEKLSKTSGGIVVVGHSLHKCYDQHIIDSINDSSSARVAISVWPHMNKEKIVSFKARLGQDLKGKELCFYNSETHPLGKVELNVLQCF
jgi:hypothetical protein